MMDKAERRSLAAERDAANDAASMTPADVLGEEVAVGLLGAGWRQRAEIIPTYVAPYSDKGERPSVKVRYRAFGSDHASYLRHSAGPRQGWFWDCYGDPVQSVGLALRALIEAYRPFGVSHETIRYDSGEHREAEEKAILDAATDQEGPGEILPSKERINP